MVAFGYRFVELKEHLRLNSFRKQQILRLNLRRSSTRERGYGRRGGALAVDEGARLLSTRERACHRRRAASAIDAKQYP